MTTTTYVFTFRLTHMKTLSLSLFSLLLLTACQENAVAEQAVSTPPVKAQEVTMIRQADDAMSLDERVTLISDLDEKTLELFSQMGPSWQDAHRSSEKFLQSLDPMARPYAEQMVATRLRNYLIPGETTQQKAEAALVYVSALVETDNQQTGLIRNAIQTYSGLWPETQTQALAEEAATAGTEYLARQAESCDACEGELAKLVDQDVRMAQINQATTDLRQIARD